MAKKKAAKVQSQTAYLFGLLHEPTQRLHSGRGQVDPFLSPSRREAEAQHAILPDGLIDECKVVRVTATYEWES